MKLMRIFFKNFITLGLVGLFLFSNLVLFYNIEVEPEIEMKVVAAPHKKSVLQIEEYILVEIESGKAEENIEIVEEKVNDEISTTARTTEETTTEEVIETTTQNNDEEYYIIHSKCTAYCSCVKCCGDYANSRPLDENGNPIIYTASGRRAVPQYSIAMSKSYAFGTMVEIPGIGMCEVMDRGGAVQGNVIDIYFGSHEEALEWGCRWLDVKVYY